MCYQQSDRCLNDRVNIRFCLPKVIHQKISQKEREDGPAVDRSKDCPVPTRDLQDNIEGIHKGNNVTMCSLRVSSNLKITIQIKLTKITKSHLSNACDQFLHTGCVLRPSSPTKAYV